MTENHSYETPSEGTTDWHLPLNRNFRALDRDVEIRDVEKNLSNYSPTTGAKFFSTDTGKVFIGDGNQWTVVGALDSTTEFIYSNDIFDTKLTDFTDGKTVYVEEGAYRLSSMGTQTGQNKTIIGVGDVVILPPKGSNGGPGNEMLALGKGTRIQNLIIDGDGADTWGVNADSFAKMHSCEIRNFTGSTNYPVQGYRSDYFEITDNRFHNISASRCCALTGQDSGQDKVEGAFIANNVFENIDADAIKVRGIKNSIITNNHIDLSEASSENKGVFMRHDTNLSLNNKIINNNIVDTGSGADTIGVKINMTTSDGYNSISNNYMNNLNRGVMHEGEKEYITGNEIHASRRYGIVLYAPTSNDCRGSVVAGNHLYDDGIGVRGAVDAIIMNNFVEGGMSYFEAEGTCVNTWGGADNTQIVGNVFLDAGDVSVQVDDEDAESTNSVLRRNLSINPRNDDITDNGQKTDPGFRLAVDLSDITGQEGEIYRHNGDSNIPISDGSTSSPGYYVWSSSDGAWKPMVIY